MLVHGHAGTGKSFLIQALKQRLKDHLLLSAFTGLAAHNINGITIHKLFCLSKSDKEISNASGGKIDELSQNFFHARYIIIDEVSMVGCASFHKIQNRLR